MKKKVSIVIVLALASTFSSIAVAQPTMAWTSSTTVGGAARSIAWSPDGMQIVTSRASAVKDVHAYNAGTGVQIWVYTFPEANDRVIDYVYSPDGSILYCAIRANSTNPTGINNRVGRLNPATGTPLGDWQPSPSGTSTNTVHGGIAMNAAGTRLAFAQPGNRVITIYNTADGSVIAQKDDLPGTATINVSMNPSGSRVSVATTGGGADWSVRLYEIDGPNLMFLGESPGLGAQPGWHKWSPDGSFLAVRMSTQLLRLDPANIGDAPLVLASGIGTAANGMVDISPDSQRIATALGAGGVGVFRASDGTLIDSLSGLGTTRPIVFSPSSASVATVNSTGSTMRVDGLTVPGTIGGTIFWEGPNSGPLPRLMVGWRTSGGSVVLPTVVIDVAPANWQVRTVGDLVPGNTDSLIWQNTDPSFSIPGLIAYWNLASNGTPSPGGTGGAPPSIDWQVLAFRDLNGNGVSDVLWINTANNLIAIWYRDAGGNVTGTSVVGNAPAGWNLVTAGTDNRLFFQNASTSQVVYWTIDNTGVVTGSTSVGTPGAAWVLQGFGQFNTAPALLFRNTGSNMLAFWEIDASGAVTGTGTLGEAPAGWSILAVGRL